MRNMITSMHRAVNFFATYVRGIFFCSSSSGIVINDIIVGALFTVGKGGYAVTDFNQWVDSLYTYLTRFCLFVVRVFVHSFHAFIIRGMLVCLVIRR